MAAPIEPTHDILQNRPQQYSLGQDPELAISTSENTDVQIDQKITQDTLKNAIAGLRENSLLNPELQMLVSTVISSLAAETRPQQPLQNTSLDSRSGAVDAVESAGPTNNLSALRKLQEVLATDSRLLQQVMDYLSLSSTARKDDLQNMGLEYERLMSTVNGFIPRLKQADELLTAHFQGHTNIDALKQQLQPLIAYLDPALIVMDHSVRMEIARLEHRQQA